MNRFEKLVMSRQKAIKSDIQLTTLRRCVEDKSQAPENIQGISMTRWIQKYYPVGKKKAGEFLNSPWAMIMASILGIGFVLKLIDWSSGTSIHRAFSKKLIGYTGQGANIQQQQKWESELQIFNDNLEKMKTLTTQNNELTTQNNEVTTQNNELTTQNNESIKAIKAILDAVTTAIVNTTKPRASTQFQSVYEIFNKEIEKKKNLLELAINKVKNTDEARRESVSIFQKNQIKRIEVFLND